MPDATGSGRREPTADAPTIASPRDCLYRLCRSFDP
jgi:hypothetical protein